MRKANKISKLICTCWETIAHNNEKLKSFRAWKHEAYQYVDLFHTPTIRAKDALVTEGVDAKKIVVIPYGVDLSRFSPAKPAKRQRKVILTVARLEPEKGMEAITKVAAQLPQYDFLVVGQGSHPTTGSNVSVRSVPYSQIPAVYRSADLFFLPSLTTPTWEEQYGMVLIEAMASGIPIVTTECGAIPEVVGPAALVVPENDVQSMVEGIDGLLAYDCAAIQLVRAGRARVAKLYDSAKVALLLARLYC